MDDKWLQEAEGFNYILDIGRAYVKTEVLFATLNLGVFETLNDACKPLSARCVAEKCLLDVGGTEALMNVCVGLKLLSRQELENGEGVYSNTPLTNKWLLKGSEKSMIPFLCGSGDDVVNLEESVRTGKCQWYGKEGTDEDSLDYNKVFGSAKSADEKASFWNLMHSQSSSEATFTSRAFDLSGFGTICDLGGCTGAFLQAVARAYPTNKLVLFDVPSVVEATPKYLSDDFDHTRLQRIAGNFFEDDLPPADLFVLSRILHDWNKKTDLVKKLLQKIFERLPPGGGVLIIEYLMNEDRTGPMQVLLSSVLMTCMQEGKELAASQYTRLLEDAGFENIQIKRSPFIGVILAIKPTV